jgi:hypothetical protein
MVSIVITSEGVEVDPLGDVEIHPAAQLFPLMQGAEFDELVADIVEHGLREPVVFTPDGELLDGRNRWRACAKAGVEPARREETSEPWAYVLSTNVHRRHLTEPQRAMIAARVSELSKQGRTSEKQSADCFSGKPPTQRQAADLMNVGIASVVRANRVLREGSPALRDAVAEGKMPVATAARIARNLPTEAQDRFVEKVAAGADASALATRKGIPTGREQQAKRGQPQEPPPPRRQANNRSPKRHQFITIPALENLLHALNGLNYLLRNTDGLDPSITDVEAAQWMSDLAKGRPSIKGVFDLLAERKESGK